MLSKIQLLLLRALRKLFLLRELILHALVFFVRSSPHPMSIISSISPLSNAFCFEPELRFKCTFHWEKFHRPSPPLSSIRCKPTYQSAKNQLTREGRGHPTDKWNKSTLHCFQSICLHFCENSATLLQLMHCDAPRQNSSLNYFSGKCFEKKVLVMEKKFSSFSSYISSSILARLKLSRFEYLVTKG